MLSGAYVAFMRNGFHAPGFYILPYVHGLETSAVGAEPAKVSKSELGTMWEIIGYVALGFACFTCLLVLGSAFDDR